ncbi:unnamed protein product [Closterium sp. Naga37s-1]|nr:unnamed protein product [Closterium sp. Naga37s-1]
MQPVQPVGEYDLHRIPPPSGPGAGPPQRPGQYRGGGGRHRGSNPGSLGGIPAIVIPGVGQLPPIPPHVVKFIRKFGPLILIITLLFAVQYLLLSIYMNVRRIKSDVKEQCASLQADLNLTAWGHMEGVRNENWRQHRMGEEGALGVGAGDGVTGDGGGWGRVRCNAAAASNEDHIMHVAQGGRGDNTGRPIAALPAGRAARAITSCTWHGADGVTILGDPSLHYPRDEPHEQYETIIIRCDLRGKVVTNLGGYLVVGIDNEHIILYREDRDSPTHALLSTTHPYRASFCTYPIADPVDGARLRDWLHVHRAYGAEHVVGYDAGGVDRAALREVKEFLDEKFLEVLPMRDVVHFRVQAQGKLMAMHDCLYRSTLTSSWVLFLDWDDILHIISPPSLSELLSQHRNVPWLSYGCQVWGTKLCMGTKVSSRTKGLMPQERMLWHWPHFLCSEGDPPVEANFCPGTRGHRYIMANTGKVFLMGESEVVDPRTGGVDLSVESVRHERFENVHKRGADIDWCSEVYGEKDTVEWWVKDGTMQTRLEMRDALTCRGGAWAGGQGDGECGPGGVWGEGERGMVGEGRDHADLHGGDSQEGVFQGLKVGRGDGEGRRGGEMGRGDGEGSEEGQATKADARRPAILAGPRSQGVHRHWGGERRQGSGGGQLLSGF